YLQNSPLMPRRIPDYPDALNGWNMICSIGLTMTLFGLFIISFFFSGLFALVHYKRTHYDYSSQANI
ncbi:hypothetical protein, partial [Vibrio splendidus]|uniref:hypothetical protein n=2 Tax=Vibrio TaxID=662 RepID=UPI001C636912